MAASVAMVYGQLRHCCRIHLWRDSHRRLCSLAEAANAKTVYIETYGCQMNVADSQVQLTNSITGSGSGGEEFILFNKTLLIAPF